MGIAGTGVDIIEIYRIKKAAGRSNKFVNMIFTPDEIRYFELRHNNPCHLAGNFAAKEAVLKVLGTGLRDIKWKDIEVVRDDAGKPDVRLYGRAALKARELGIKHIHLSISHSRDYAVAVAVGEGD